MGHAGVTPTRRGLPFLPALDGIRAVAVSAVLLYHADIVWTPGGFLGVEVFFVLSGYLITCLLWTERASTGTVSLPRFYARRARRLLPALFVMLGVVLAAFLIAWPEEIGRIRGEAAAAFAYVSNWYLIGIDQSYFTTLGRPSPFAHLWSLAIEEQFYVVWPVLLGGLALLMRRSARVAATIAAGAAVSALAMWLIYSGGDPSRVYFGTDTRAAGLLMGAALAVVWRPFEQTNARFRPTPRALDLAFIGSSAVLVWAFLRYDEFTPFTYRPGIQLVALATILLIAASVHPAARLARVLGWAPLRALGRRAYAIYLWHWPVFVVTRPGVDLDISVGRALLLRVAITLVLADLSYRFVEEPIRDGRFMQGLRGLVDRAWYSPASFRRLVVGGSGTLVVGVIGLGVLASALVRAPAPQASELEIQLRAEEAAARAPVAVPLVLEISREFPPRVFPAPRGKVAPLPRLAKPVPLLPRVKADALALGDSVMLGARSTLTNRIRGMYVDASVSRATHDGIARLRELRRRDRLSDTVVIHLGNNGAFIDDQFEQIMHVLRDVPKVIFINVKVPRRWESSVNRTIAAGVPRYETAHLIDWHDRWRGCPGTVFASDGYHLTSEGARCYASLIAAML
jgi:peptidoglycan/LPS O-acetylase OafA/YrhL